MPSALDRLRDHLLPKTLEHAARNSTFYAEHLGEHWSEVTTVADLSRLPILDKETAVEHQEAMRCGVAPDDFGAVSSGTTRVGKRLLRIERSPDEAAALDDFRRMLDEAQPRAEGQVEETLPPRVLHIITPNHGLPATAPPPHTLRLAWASSLNVVQMIEQALSEEHEGRKISVMRISVSALKQVTLALMKSGANFDDFALEAIGTNAALVTTRWRKLLEAQWGAKVFDNYSLSEIVTPATECEACGWYHFGEPPVIVELVDPFSEQVQAEGVGHLLLTGLFPYVQRQPLIRYATGDLVERGPYCEFTDDHGIRFRGRVRHSLVRATKSGTDYLLFPSVIENYLDDLPEIARHRHPFEKVEDLPPYQVGTPKLSANLEGDRLCIRAGLLFEPRLFPERAADLAKGIRQTALEEHPALAGALERGELQLDIELEAAFDDDESRWIVKYLM